MPITFLINPEKRRVFSVARGTLTLEAVLLHIQARSRAGVLDFDQIFDMRESTLGFGADEVEPAVNAMRERTGAVPKCHTAIVTEDDDTYRVAQQMVERAERLEYRAAVFRTIEAAEWWLAQQRSPITRAQGLQFMGLEAFAATKRAIQQAKDTLQLDALEASITRAYPDDPEAAQLVREIAEKRARLELMD